MKIEVHTHWKKTEGKEFKRKVFKIGKIYVADYIQHAHHGKRFLISSPFYYDTYWVEKEEIAVEKCRMFAERFIKDLTEGGWRGRVEKNMNMIKIEDRRNWKEDFGIENGKYLHDCSECNNYFLGHKYRKVCKVCKTKTR